MAARMAWPTFTGLKIMSTVLAEARARKQEADRHCHVMCHSYGQPLGFHVADVLSEQITVAQHEYLATLGTVSHIAAFCGQIGIKL